jgi:hypothetical protein
MVGLIQTVGQDRLAVVPSHGGADAHRVDVRSHGDAAARRIDITSQATPPRRVDTTSHR